MPSKRPFIAVRYIDEKTSKVHEDTFVHIKHMLSGYKLVFEGKLRLKQTPTTYENGWFIHSKDISHVDSPGALNNSDLEYLARLIKGEPCGQRRTGIEGERLLEDGKTSVIHLI